MNADGHGPHFRRLTAWAQSHELTVRASGGNQRDPENVVAIADGDDGHASTLIRKTSLDSVDTAALYLIDALGRLGITVP